MAVSDPTMSVPTPTGVLQGVAAFNWDGAAWQPAGRAGPSVATPTGNLQGVAAFNGSPPQPAGRAGPGVPTPTGVLDGVAVYTWSGSQWTPPGGSPTPSTPSGALRGVAAFDWDGTAWQPVGQAGPDVATPYGVLQGVARFNWTGTAWTATGAPSLSLDFMTPGALDPRITFTRASTATYTDASGTIRTAAINAPRWDYDPVTHALRGVLIEEARTNLLLNSGDVSAAANWVKTSFSGPAAPVVTANQAAAPDGTLTAASIAYPAVSAGGGCIVYQTFIATVNPYAVSIWLRGALGGEQVYLMATPNDGATYYRATAVLTTAWQRLAVVTPNLTAVSWFVMIGVDLRDAGQTAKPAQTVYAWGAQAERGAFATSYMPTTVATATRAQDTCTIPTSGGWYNANNWSLLAEFQDMPGATALFGLSDATFGNSCYLGSDAGAALSVVYAPSGGGTANGPAVSRTAVNKAAFSFTTTRLALAVNGSAVNAAVQATTALSTATRLSMGNDPWSLTTAFSGHMRRVGAWPRTLADAELQGASI